MSISKAIEYLDDAEAIAELLKRSNLPRVQMGAYVTVLIYYLDSEKQVIHQIHHDTSSYTPIPLDTFKKQVPSTYKALMEQV